MRALPLLNYDLQRLAVSTYLQGVEDGYEAAQREFERNQANASATNTP